jgi:hypothetical protein
MEKSNIEVAEWLRKLADEVESGSRSRADIKRALIIFSYQDYHEGRQVVYESCLPNAFTSDEISATLVADLEVVKLKVAKATYPRTMRD